MTGKKGTKTGLWMIPLSMYASMISPVTASKISQVASDVPQPITAADHHRLQAKPNLHASASSARENSVFFMCEPKHTFVFVSPKLKKLRWYAEIYIQFDANHKYGRIGEVPSSKCVLPAKIIIPPRNHQPAIQVLPRIDLPTDQQASPAIFSNRKGTHDTPTKWRAINKTQFAGHP